jgi:hypothetical protein
MPLIRRAAEAFPFEHMPQVAATIRTGNLRPAHAQGPILPPINSAWHAFEESRPPAPAIELTRACVKRCAAAHAGVDSGRGVVAVGPAVGGLGAAGAEDAELLRGEDRAPFVVGFLDRWVCTCGHFAVCLVGGGSAEGRAH